MKWLSVLLSVLCLTGCQGNPEQRLWMEPSDKLKVLSTVGMVDDLVRQVGGEHVDRITLIQGELDPHSYELVKGDDEKLIRADLIFCSGLGLEHGPSLHRYLHDSNKVTAIGDSIVSSDPEAVVRIDGQVDPHIWMDVSLWLQGADVVADALANADPEHAASYRSNADACKKRLKQLDFAMKKEMHAVPIERRYLVTNHDAFNYFTRRYLATPLERKEGSWQERCTAPEGLAPEGRLSTRDIQKVIEHLAAYDINVLFPESNLTRQAIRKITSAGQQKGLDIHIAETPLYADAMGEGNSYADMMKHNAHVIAQSLRGGL